MRFCYVGLEMQNKTKQKCNNFLSPISLTVVRMCKNTVNTAEPDNKQYFQIYRCVEK